MKLSRRVFISFRQPLVYSRRRRPICARREAAGKTGALNQRGAAAAQRRRRAAPQRVALSIVVDAPNEKCDRRQCVWFASLSARFRAHSAQRLRLVRVEKERRLIGRRGQFINWPPSVQIDAPAPDSATATQINIYFSTKETVANCLSTRRRRCRAAQLSPVRLAGAEWAPYDSVREEEDNQFVKWCLTGGGGGGGGKV